MLLLYILNLIILLELASGVYNYSRVKEINLTDQKTENTKNISLVIIIFLTLFILLINSLYLLNIINYKRSILNFILLSIIGSIFILINYIYLNLQQKSPSGYEAAKKILEANSENTNKDIKDYNIITFIISISLTFLILSFYIGYQFFSREKIRKIREPQIIEKNLNKIKKRNIDRLKLF